MRPVDTDILAVRIREELLRRNSIFEAFFRREGPRLAKACYEMFRHFLWRIRENCTIYRRHGFV